MRYSAVATGALALWLGVAGTLAGSSAALAQAAVKPGEDARLYELAKQEGSLVWYESGPLEAMQAVAHDFEAAYPGVKVVVQRIVGVAQYQRFLKETQAQQYIVDVLGISDQPSMADLTAQGMLVNWKVPTHDRFPADMRIGDTAYAAYINDNVVVYNTRKVTPEEIAALSESWKGLLDPRFKGRIAITAQSCGACYSAVHMFLDPKLKDQYGVKFLEALAAQKPAVYSDIVTVVDRVLSGERDIGVWPAEGVGFTKWADGAPIRWLRPKPTPIYGANWQGISKFAPHPNAARLFEDWSMSEAGAKSVQLRYGAIITLSGIPDIRPVAKESWYPAITDKYIPDFDRWTKNFDSDMALWTKILKSGQ